MLTKIKKVLGCKTGRDLAKKIGVHDSQVTRYKKDGFGGAGTERIIELLLEIIELLEENQN